MIIEESDFKLELTSDYNTYDLELLYTVNAKDPDKKREEFKNAGYNMSMDYCMKKIISYRLSKRLDTVNLSTFIKEYKEEHEKLRKLIKI